MPVRRRLSAAPVREVDPLSAFRWSDTGDGCSHALGGAHYRDRHEAARAWEKARRVVWAAAFRYTVPDPAQIYDGLSTAGLEHVRFHWNHVGRFDLRGALAALAKDRAHLAAFTQTPGARQIDDYLALFREDLDTVEQAARDLANTPPGVWLRPYPKHLNVGTRYGYVDPSSSIH